MSERELQIARDLELAFYMDANGGEFPNNLGTGETEATELASGHGDHERRIPGAFPDENVVAESSATAAARGERQNEDLVQCASCTEDKPRTEVLTAPCGDLYCRVCLAELFQRSMTDETLFPPRCCRQSIPLEQARPLLEVNLATEFEGKFIERSTADRTYCHNPRCGTFIPPATIQNDVGICPTCGRRTCSMCKAASHQGDCPNDTGLQQLMATAGGERWRRCDRCRRFIELTIGCNHMT